eukprot:TRINITY_DN77582_c0_g1_i1.p1 TRINITY_DN77582_c0_g1~~TRINITY_DN77582_c0_g1_i1.p1  ORF type:complete len:240 (-),score=21.91 TRINITY_DN77582_c0_g1_i1:77-736(-)
MVERDAPIVVEGNSSTELEEAISLLQGLVLPHLPPVIQQELTNSNAETRSQILNRVVSQRVVDGGGEVVFSMHGVRHAFSSLSDMRATGEFERLLTANPLWYGAEADEDEAGEGHAVKQGSVANVALALGAQGAVTTLVVEYKSKTKDVHVPPTITGLMLKSKVIAEFGLPGGFQDYYLRLGGEPFGSRTAIKEHPGFTAGALIVLEEVGERPKAQGMT